MHPKQELFTIGEFSKVTGVGIHSLRYYDEIGALKPEYVDPVSNYRYYSFDQLRCIPGINICRDAGLKLSEFGQFVESDTINYSKLFSDSYAAIEDRITMFRQQQKSLKRLEGLFLLRDSVPVIGSTILNFGGLDIWLMPYADRAINDNETDILIKLSSHARRRGCQISPICFGLIEKVSDKDTGTFAFAAVSEISDHERADKFIYHIPQDNYLISRSSKCSLDYPSELSKMTPSGSSDILVSISLIGDSIRDNEYFATARMI